MEKNTCADGFHTVIGPVDSPSSFLEAESTLYVSFTAIPSSADRDDL
jgi:hypothetical protein